MAYNNSYGNNGSYAKGNSGGFGSRPMQEDKSEIKAAVEIKEFYNDGTKIPKVDLFDATAQKVAESFVGKDSRGFTVGVSSTQLRRLFDEVKRYEQVLASPDSEWDEQLPYIKMIKSKVAYTVARASKNKKSESGVYKNLETFISSAINQVKEEKDYHVFVNLFEAVYGFYYEKAPKESNN